MSAAALLLSDDLIDASRVAGAGRAAGITIRQVRTAAALEALARQEPPRLVLIDLANPSLSVEGLMRGLREACPALPRVVAYGPHVDAAGLRAARAAGCDVVLPRSAFVEELPHKLAEWAGG